MANVKINSDYTEDSIRVLDDITHVRTRPTMYLDSSRPTHQMFNEIFDNALDEAMNGYADTIHVDIKYKDNVCSISDNGRGIPQGINKDLNLPTPQVIYTKLNSGGKYDRDSYGFSGGLNGVGSVCVNALSSIFEVTTWRDKSLVNMYCNNGILKGYSQDKYNSEDSGTCVLFSPDTSHKFIFDRFEDYKLDIEDRLYLMKSLLPKVTFTYNGFDIKEKSFTSFLKEPLAPLFEEPIYFEYKDLRVAINWSTENNKYLTKCFCNSVYNPNGGDHEKGIYDAITEAFGSSDYSLGVSFVVSSLYPDVEYDTQVKLKAISKDMRNYIKETFSWLLKKYFKQNPDDKKKLDELISSKRRAIDKKNNKSTIKRNRRNSFLNNLGVSGFSDCTTKDREKAELYICEGNSAAGSAIQARNVETQAILPIRGKIINALNSDVASLFKNAEVSTIMSSINAGTFDDVDIRNSRYGKIIIFADADPDGHNIACLLLSLFCTMTPALVDNGFLYLALPPLYGTYVKKQFIPINDEETKNAYLKKGYEIQRYKGLGEMTPEQLRVSCMNPATRQVMQVKTTKDCYDIVKKIMGGSSKYRKELLREVGVLFDK